MFKRVQGDRSNIYTSPIGNMYHNKPQVPFRVDDPRDAEWFRSQGARYVEISPVEQTKEKVADAIGEVAERITELGKKKKKRGDE